MSAFGKEAWTPNRKGERKRTRIPLVDLAHPENESQPTRDTNPILRRLDARLDPLAAAAVDEEGEAKDAIPRNWTEVR